MNKKIKPIKVKEESVAVIQEQDNSLFKITHNKELDYYEMILKKDSYKTAEELIPILSFLHQTGIHCPKSALSIGYEVKPEKPKIITNA